MTGEKAYFAGWCFWCLEGAFRRLKWVEVVTSWYMGWTRENPTYESVCLGTTGHTETVEVAFDPTTISYRTLLEIFFLLHDPTTRNRQGADIGTQYRSAIFAVSEEQHSIAESVIETEQRRFPSPIVTELSPARQFWRAEEHHQGYYDTHREAPYCRLVIDPKIEKLKKRFGGDGAPKSENVTSCEQ